jgi:D-serine deaminase-like pyridoxal phosphate-dependent protein
VSDWDAATAELQPPFAVVDLDAFDANADDLVRRAGGTPIRVASKSVRCRSLLRRVLDRPGFHGVMAYAVPESLWLVEHGETDVFVAYPSVDRPALRRVVADTATATAITVCIDGVDHVRLLAELGAEHPFRVAIDVDASLRIGPIHLGVRRSPLGTPDQVTAVARAA